MSDTGPRVAVLNPFFKFLPHIEKELLDKYPNTKFWEGPMPISPEDLVDFCQDVEIIIPGIFPYFTEEVISALPNLKTVSCPSAGLDHIDAEVMKRHGIKVWWQPGINKESVAELAVSLMINLIRKVNRTNTILRSGEWPRTGKDGMLIRGRTVGIHGCGHIGKEVVKYLQPFGVNIIASDRNDYADFYKEYNVTPVDADTLWAESDILTIHLSKNKSTIGMYTEEVLSKLKHGIYLVNTARGGIVDENGLEARLKDGRIAAAAFDVFADEPTDRQTLIDLPNFLATPHIGGSAVEAWEAMSRSAIHGAEKATVPEPGIYPYD